MTLRRLAVAFGLGVVLVVVTPAVASAHPLGNFTINRYAGLRVAVDHVDVDYVVDMAEIPTFQHKSDIDRDGNGQIDDSERARYQHHECARLARGVRLDVDGAKQTVASRDGALTFLPGQAGLETLRLECRLRATATGEAGEHTVAFADGNFAERVGWKEITAVGDGATLVGSKLSSRSVSARLTRYPADRLQSPPDDRRAELRYRPGGTGAPSVPVHTPAGSVVRGFDRFTQRFTSSVAARRLTVGLALVALAIGVGLGALHAFAPGHGKTVMAAYLVGERGTVRDGLLIGVTVAATHTLGVLVLGGVLTASQAFAPEQVYPWLGLASGVCFVALGATLLVGAIRRRGMGRALLHHHRGAPWHAPDGQRHDARHDHAHDHAHAHVHAHTHTHPHPHEPTPALSRRRLLTLGFAGGLVPTPTAVVVLLGATALGRAWFGVVLVLAYGVGMASTLIAAGLLLARARRRFDLKARSERALRIAAALPIATATVITGSGLILVVRAATSL